MSLWRVSTESRGDQRTGSILLRRLSRVTWWACGLFALLAVCTAAGVRLNLTGSLPIGLYVVTHGPPTRDAVVLVCLPEAWAELARSRGYVPNGNSCTGGAMPVGKPVFALPGDTVVLTESGLILNGRPVANTRPLPFDRRGRPLPRLEAGAHVVGAGELWIVSRYSPFSFDSRYFGAVPLANVRARVRLLVPFQRSRPDWNGDAALYEPGEVEPPGYEAPQLPDVEDQVDVGLGVSVRPAVDSHQLLDRIVASTFQV
jgi:conjugative transfer signal peptidase TraF